MRHNTFLIISIVLVTLGVLAILFFKAERTMAATTKAVKVGDRAPDFTLPAFPEGEFTLSDAKGHIVVLYFYPKDDTPGCTKEACGFRDLQEEFEKQGAQIWGVSSDSLESHDAFAAKYGLKFPLLSDDGGKVRALFGNPSGLQLPLIMRITYVIDAEGIVRKVITGEGPGDWEVHIKGAQEAVAELNKAQAEEASSATD